MKIKNRYDFVAALGMIAVMLGVLVFLNYVIFFKADHELWIKIATSAVSTFTLIFFALFPMRNLLDSIKMP